eukprot:13946906-Alexandrium_andersonii.AAC.2
MVGRRSGGLFSAALAEFGALHTRRWLPERKGRLAERRVVPDERGLRDFDIIGSTIPQHRVVVVKHGMQGSYLQWCVDSDALVT